MNGSKAVSLLFIALLMVSMIAVVPVKASQTTSIKPSDNAYVAADLNDNGTDKLGLRSLSTGNLPILKVWYAWNLTIVNKTGQVVGYIPVKIVTVAYFKFDLSSTNGQTITNATLRLYSQNSNLTGASRFLVAYSVPNTSWSQSNLDWYNAPSFDTKVNSSVSVTNGVKAWYGIDLTKMAQNASGKELSVAVTFLILYKHNEEQVVFNSTRATGAQPYLLVTYSGSAPFSLGGMFDFSNGVNSTNAVGLLVIAVAIILIILAIFMWRRRGARGGPKPKSKAPPKDKGGERVPGGMALGAKCPNCGAAVESDFRVCPNCSKALTEKVCGSCGKAMKLEFKVCPYCGNNTG